MCGQPTVYGVFARRQEGTGQQDSATAHVLNITSAILVRMRQQMTRSC